MMRVYFNNFTVYLEVEEKDANNTVYLGDANNLLPEISEMVMDYVFKHQLQKNAPLIQGCDKKKRTVFNVKKIHLPTLYKRKTYVYSMETPKYYLYKLSAHSRGGKIVSPVIKIEKRIWDPQKQSFVGDNVYAVIIGPQKKLGLARVSTYEYKVGYFCTGKIITIMKQKTPLREDEAKEMAISSSFLQRGENSSRKTGEEMGAGWEIIATGMGSSPSGRNIDFFEIGMRKIGKGGVR